MADENLKNNVTIFGDKITSTMLPNNFSTAYEQYVINNDQQSQNVAGRANQAAQGAYEAQARNDEQDVILDDHETRIAQNESDINSLDGRVDNLEYVTTRKKSEVIYTGISQVIPTTSTNLITMLKALTPTSGTLAPFFNTTSDKMVVYNENKTLNFKLSIVGTFPGGTTNRSMQLTFSGAVPDTLVDSRNAATSTSNILMATFFSVDKDGFLATNGSTLTIQANGAAFTATTIKIIAEQ